MLKVVCDCGARLKLPEEHLGRAVSCPRCQKVMRAVSGGGEVAQFASRLVVESGPGNAGDQFLLAGEGAIEIGKLEGNHIRLQGQQVSRSHCRLLPTIDGGWAVEDNRSTNGIHVNGQRIECQTLRHGDRLRIGDFILLFKQPGTGTEPALAGESLADARSASAGGTNAASAIGLGSAAANALSEPSGSTAGRTMLRSSPPIDEDANDRLYDLAAAAEVPSARAVSAPPPLPARAIPVTEGGPKCPGCGQQLPVGAKICVACGIDVKSGRAIVISRGFDENDLAIRADTWIKIVSWIIPFGLFPIASEAFGTRKPFTVWTIAGITVLASLVFFPVACNLQEDPSPQVLNLMMWTGNADASDEPMDARLQEALEDERVLVAPGVGFRWYQLLTNALLHADLMHLAGNLLFLLVFGLRVNELVGNLRMAVIYPLLAVTSSAAQLVMSADGPLMPCLGASGAIMGLAGMYLVFFPAQKVHMCIWLRVPIWSFPLVFITGIRCRYKLWCMRGFWLLVLWIGLNDVLPVVLEKLANGGQAELGGVGHWAHLGGFVSGAAVAMILLLTWQTSARGTDLLSVVLGKRAWGLMGKPANAAVG